MRKTFLLCALTSIAALAAPQAWGLNIIRPGDPIIPIDTTQVITTGSSSPGGEQAPNILDNNPGTKYLNFGITDTGFIVTPAAAAALQSMVITTANDAVERDPKSVRIYGTNSPITSVAHSRGDSEPWTEITGAPLTFDLPLTRLTTGAPINIANGASYSSYKVVFPEVRNLNDMGVVTNANSMQIADVSFFTGQNGTGTSMLAPTNFIIPIRDVEATVSPRQSNSPDNEAAPNSIDRNTGTKYLNFGELDSGVIVTPSIGASVATGFKITTANDAPERDPTSYAIYGTNEAINSVAHDYGTENNWVLISQGTITPPDARFTESEEITFANNTAYTSYRITFPTVRDEATANSMQVAEISLTAPDAATLIVNRQTGAVRIRADQNVTFSAYELESLINGLNPDGWNSITSTNADPNDTWTETSATAQLLAEEDLPTGSNNGFTLTAGNSLALGNVWQALPVTYESNLTFSLFGLTGNLIADGVEFEGTEIPLGDYSGNGTVGPEDWPLFRAGLGGEYQGMSLSEAYLGGDLDGDFDSDITDFNIFVAAAGGFNALFGPTASVPEPSSVALIALAAIGGFGFKYRRRVSFRPAAMMAIVAAAALVGTSASAQTFTNVGGAPGVRGNPGSITTPDDVENAASGPENLFDDDFLDDAGAINGELFLLDYNDPDLQGTFTQYAGLGATPKTVFIDYNQQVSANWFAYAQRSGGDPTADRVGMFEFWFSNSPFNNTLPATPPDSVVKLDPGDDRILDSALRPYTLDGTKTGQYVAIRLTVSEVSASRPTNNIGGHEFRLLSGPSDVVLEVNRATGAMTLRNNGAGAQDIAMQAITIESNSGGLNAAGYNGIRGDSGFPLGSGDGNGWEIGGGSNAKRIVEAYFNGESTLTAGTAGIALGNAYNPLTLAEDLTFRWTTNFVDDGDLIVQMYDGVVRYVGTAPDILPGDYNGDDVVDAADYTVWRNNLGTNNAMANDSTPGSVDIDDYERWKLNYGNTGSAALAVSASAVPEPSSIVLSLLFTVVGATAIRRRLG